MNLRCSRCGAWNADSVRVCSCGNSLSGPGKAARIHREAPRAVDPSEVNERRLGSRRDLRNGALLLGLLIPFSVGLAVLGGRVSYLALGLIFWGVILIVRGFRLRREAWEAEHIGR